MSRAAPTDLGRALVRFFEEYLAAQRGLSPHTIRGYRDTLILLLQFMSRDAGRGVEHLSIRDISAERVAQFLRFTDLVGWLRKM
jgi:site-specific recombinase XerD